MDTSAILYGYKGYVGREIYRQLQAAFPLVLGIDRSTFCMEPSLKSFDFVIHSANPAGRYSANISPLNDRNEVIPKTLQILRNHPGSKRLLISSISCRTQSDTPYGRHRYEAEQSWISAGGMVVRLGPMYGGCRTKDTIHDIVSNSPVYYSSSTLYAYADVSWVAKYIVESLLHQYTPGHISEIGARNTVSLRHIADHVNSSSTFSGSPDHQYPLGFSEGPDASDVLVYAKSIKYSS